jgi:hypothetical protein
MDHHNSQGSQDGNQDINQWLVRTAQNWIAGPYTREQTAQMILEGKLSLEDEVCAASGYWIYLHEREEILKHLNIEVPRMVEKSEEEVTETQTQTEVKTQTDLNLEQRAPAALSSAGSVGTPDSMSTFNSFDREEQPARLPFGLPALIVVALAAVAAAFFIVKSI